MPLTHSSPFSLSGFSKTARHHPSQCSSLGVSPSVYVMAFLIKNASAFSFDFINYTLNQREAPRAHDTWVTITVFISKLERERDQSTVLFRTCPVPVAHNSSFCLLMGTKVWTALNLGSNLYSVATAQVVQTSLWPAHSCHDKLPTPHGFLKIHLKNLYRKTSQGSIQSPVSIKWSKGWRDGWLSE